MENAETIAFQFPEFVTQCIQQEKGSKKEKREEYLLTINAYIVEWNPSKTVSF